MAVKRGSFPVSKSPMKFDKKKVIEEKGINFSTANEATDGTIYYCTACGKGYPANIQDKSFPFSGSPFYKNNNKRLSICNDCFDLTVSQYTDLLGSQDDAIKRVCMHFDMYYDEGVLASSRNINKQNSRIKQYIKLLNLSQSKGKTYDTYLEEMKTKDKILTENDVEQFIENEIEKEEEKRDFAKAIKDWGYGFAAEDYDFLTYKYDEMKASNVVDDSTKDKYVRDICMMSLLQNKALLKNEIDQYQKLTTALQTTLKNAGLTPKQKDKLEKDSEKPIGVMIDEFENKRPVPEPLPEWKDVDGIMKIILVYFIGHLCKMIGLKNRYSKMYEDEMEKYRPQMEDSNNATSEDIFEYLLGNEFDNVTISSSDNVNEDLEKLIPESVKQYQEPKPEGTDEPEEEVEGSENPESGD